MIHVVLSWYVQGVCTPARAFDGMDHGPARAVEGWPGARSARGQHGVSSRSAAGQQSASRRSAGGQRAVSTRAAGGQRVASSQSARASDGMNHGPARALDAVRQQARVEPVLLRLLPLPLPNTHTHIHTTRHVCSTCTHLWRTSRSSPGSAGRRPAASCGSIRRQRRWQRTVVIKRFACSQRS